MKPFLTIMIFFLTVSVSAQERMSLRTIPFTPQSNEKVYVAAVIDRRKVKSLGIQEKINGEKTELFLKDGAEKAIEIFYGESLKKDSHKEPVYIEFKSTKCSGIKTKG